MRILFTFISLILIITNNCFAQVTLVAGDNGNKSLTTSSGGNFELLRGTTTIATWSGTQTGGTYFTSPATSGIGSVASGSSSGNSIRLSITNNTGSTISNLTLNCSILHHKDNNTANLTETLVASGVSGATNWNLGVTSNGNTTSDINNPPLASSFSGTISGLSFANGTTITITWSDSNDAGTDAMFGLGAASLSWTVLPIKIKSFDVYTFNNKNSLKLITASETNNDYFTIERSADGKAFEAIGEIAGAGNSSREISYEFVDDKPMTGINYYRIKQTDYDGQYSYSEIKSVRHKGVNNLSVTPRTTEGSLYITTDMDDYSISIFTAAGQEVKSFTSMSLDQNISIEELKAGIYFVRVNNGSNSETIRIVKI